MATIIGLGLFFFFSVMRGISRFCCGMSLSLHFIISRDCREHEAATVLTHPIWLVVDRVARAPISGGLVHTDRRSPSTKPGHGTQLVSDEMQRVLLNSASCTKTDNISTLLFIHKTSWLPIALQPVMVALSCTP
jgi:hypothetical protein